MGESLMIDAARLLHDQMKLAESQAEAWKQDYKEASACHLLEFFLRTWLRFLDEIGECGNQIRLLVLQGKAEASAEASAERLYRTWLSGAETVMPFLIELEGKGYQVERSEDFRRGYREVKGILTPDDEFFSGNRLIELRDKAIDAHRRGETEDWEVPVS
jgi:hypothetical protein